MEAAIFDELLKFGIGELIEEFVPFWIIHWDADHFIELHAGSFGKSTRLLFPT